MNSVLRYSKGKRWRDCFGLNYIKEGNTHSSVPATAKVTVHIIDVPLTCFKKLIN